MPAQPQRSRTALEVVAGTKDPRCFDSRLVRDRPDALWGIDVGIPEDSTQLLVKAVVGAKARPPLRNGDRIVAIGGANCAEVKDLSDVIPNLQKINTSATLRVERPFRGVDDDEKADAPPRRRPSGNSWWRRMLSWSPAESEPTPHAYAISGQLLALRGGAALAGLAARQRRAPLGSILGGLAPTDARLLLLNVGDARLPSTIVDALEKAVPREMGWRAAKGSHTPTTRHVVYCAYAIGAWLALDDRHRCILVDVGGGHVRIGLLAAAALCLAPDVCDLARAESASAAYEAWLRAADLEASLALRLLPPSFARFLGHVDVLAVKRARPNADRLYLARLALVAPQAILSAATHVEIGDETESCAAPLADDKESSRSATKAVFDAKRPLEDFSVTLRAADGSRILRFSSSAAFSGVGVLVAKRDALDVFPQYRSPVPPHCDVDLRLDLRRADSDGARPPLLPSAPDALAVELDAALSGPLSAGAYDLAQKCDVEIWVAAAALRAVGGESAAARLFIDECPGLLCTPGPDDAAVAPFRPRADVLSPAPRRKPPRRRGLSLPPQPLQMTVVNCIN